MDDGFYQEKIQGPFSLLTANDYNFGNFTANSNFFPLTNLIQSF